MIEFREPELAERFARDGYVVIPLLGPDDVASLRSQFAASQQSDVDGFWTSVEGRTVEESRRVGAAIDHVVVPRLDEWIIGFSVIGSAFLAKGPDATGELTLHQDWTSVDERRAWSVNVWCSLDDVGTDGGCLEVVAGSHAWFENARSPVLPSAQVPLSGEIEPHLTALPVSAGDAVIYDHRLFHGSRQNRLTPIRRVAQLGLRPSEERLVMAFPVDDYHVELRPVDDAAYYGSLADAPSSGRDDAPLPGGTCIREVVPTEPSDVWARLSTG